MVVTLGGSFLYSGLALLISTLSKTESYQGIGGFPEDFKFVSNFQLFGVIPFQLLIYILMLVIRVHSAAQDQVWSSHHPGWR